MATPEEIENCTVYTVTGSAGMMCSCGHHRQVMANEVLGISMPVQSNVDVAEGGEKFADLPTFDAEMILGKGGLLEEWANEFLSHNAEYIGQERQFGHIAELIEMTRKLNKLKAAWWDGANTKDWRETPETILKELISHAFLALVSIRHAKYLLTIQKVKGVPFREEDL